MTRLSSLALLATTLVVPTTLSAQFPTEPPPAAPLGPVRFPPFQEASLPNGLKIILVENHQLPIVSFSLSIPTGAVNEPAAMHGLADMTAELLTKGTTTRTADQISERIEGVGGSLNASAGNDNFSISSTVLADHAALAFDLAADVLLHPTFPDDELELARRRTLSALRLAKSQPAAVAGRFFSHELYGDHPYGQSPTEETVQAITRDAVQQFASEQLKPQGSLLVIAGDLTLEQARDLARTHFGSWTGRVPDRSYGRPPRPHATDILLVNRPGSEQSNILVGNLAMRPGDPMYYGAVVANKVLGGGSDARLFQILREERGWTYGSYSNISRPLDVGRFQASAEVRTPVTDSALAELMHQLRRIRTEPIPDSTLRAAQGFLTGVFPLTIETPQQVAGQVAATERLGLGREYLSQYRQRIAAVTAQQAERAARAVIHPDSAVIVVVGDGTKIYDGLAAIAPVRIVDVDGNRMTPDDLAPPAATALDVDPGRLPTGTDSLGVSVQGQQVGALTRTTTVGADGVQYQMTMVIAMAGLNVGVTGQLHAGNLKPVTVHSTMALGGGAPLEATLTYDGGHVTGQRLVQPSAPGQRPTVADVDTTFAMDVYSSDQLITLIQAAPLSAGASFTVPIYQDDRNTQSMYTVSVAGRESLTVPAGTFDAWRVNVTGNEAATYWFAADGPHRLLKMELAGQPVSFELVH